MRTIEEVEKDIEASSKRIEASKRWELTLMEVRGKYARWHIALEAELSALKGADNDRAG